MRVGPTSSELEEIKRLKKENRDLQETNEILRDFEGCINFLREETRPSQPLIVGFIDRMRSDGHGVESTCDALREQGITVAPRSYRAWKTRAPAARAYSDATIVDVLRGLRKHDAKGRRQPEILYGRRKMTAWLARNGFPQVSKHTPISLENARLAAERFPGLLELPLGGSLYELLQSEYGIEPIEAEEKIEVVFATADEGLILGVAAGSPLLSITRTSLDSSGIPIEHSHDLFRADRTRITVRTKGDPVTTASTTTRGNIVEFRTRT